jgi:hypothetical protein
MCDLQFWILVQKILNNFGPDSYYEASTPDIMIFKSNGTVLSSSLSFTHNGSPNWQLWDKEQDKYKILARLECHHFNKQQLYWPVVCILSNGSEEVGVFGAVWEAWALCTVAYHHCLVVRCDPS